MSAQPLPNSNYYLDQMMSIEMIKNLCSGKGKSEIAKFILIIGMDEFKRLFKVIIDKFIKEFQEFNWSNWLPSLFSWILRILTKPFRMLFSRSTSRVEQDLDFSSFHDLESLNFDSHSCVLKTSSKMQHSFWEQVCSEAYKDRVTYHIKDIKSFDQTDNLTINSVEVWDSIKLSLPEQKMVVEFDEEVELRFSTRYNKKTLVSLKGQGGSTVSIGKFQNFTEKDFSEDNPVSLEEFQSFCNHMGLRNKRKYPTKVCKITFDRLIPSSKSLTESLEKAYQAVAAFIDASKEFNIHTMFKDWILPDTKLINPSFILKDATSVVTFDLDYFKFKNKPFFYYHRLILLLSIFIYDCVDDTTRQCKNLSNEKDKDDYLNYRTGASCRLLTENVSDMSGAYIFKLFGVPTWHPFTSSIGGMQTRTLKIHKQIGEKVRKMPFFENETNWRLLINHLCSLLDMCPMYIDNNKPQAAPENASGSLPIRVLSNDYTSQEDLQKAFFNYLNTFSSTKTSQKATKIKTFDIKIEYKEKKVSTPNPAYTLQQKRLEELRKAPSSEPIDKLISELIAAMPSETTDDVQVLKEVVCTPINEVYKDLSRLYLAKKDKQKLTSMLRDFRDDKEMMEDLGLPNKLAVLLYGEPGCGKSSTIETVGSYLQKDIYNLDLETVKTNEDLAKLWDYVTNQTANGGCIVIEDIDASTDVVLARTLQSTNDNRHTVIQVMPNETPLSLSYFLNIIQGSCQRDNSVVIVTTNYLEKLDPAFTRSMRFDVKINMKKSSIDQIIEMYSVYFSRRTVPLDLIKQIPEYKYTPAMFIDCFRQHIKNPDITDEELFADFL